MIESKNDQNKKKATYAMDPHVKPTNRYWLSDMLRAEGVPRPSVFNLTGVSDSLRLHLYKAEEVEK